MHDAAVGVEAHTSDAEHVPQLASHVGSAPHVRPVHVGVHDVGFAESTGGAASSSDDVGPASSAAGPASPDPSSAALSEPQATTTARRARTSGLRIPTSMPSGRRAVQRTLHPGGVRGVLRPMAAKKKSATAKKTTVKPAAKKKKAAAAAKKKAAATKKAALCSSRVVGPKRKAVLFAYRQEPDNDMDSGWRFLHGDESESFLGDAKNCLVTPMDLVLAMDPTLEGLLERPVGAAFRRASVAAKWELLEDYDPEG